MEDDQKTTEQEASIVELLAMPEVADIEFEPPRLEVPVVGTSCQKTRQLAPIKDSLDKS